jgi:hypothetical protein
VLPIIREIQKTGATQLRAIADALNARGVKSARGGKWYAASVAGADLSPGGASAAGPGPWPPGDGGSAPLSDTYGAVAELYLGNWALRGGLFECRKRLPTSAGTAP